MKALRVLCIYGFLSIISNFAWADNSCLEDCSLEKLENGDYDVFCSCKNEKYPRLLFEKKKSHFPGAKKFMGASPQDIKELQQGCQQKTNYQLDRSSSLHFLELQTRPLCECAYVRTLFSTEKKCTLRPSGENLCKIVLKENKILDNKPIRSISIYDLQSCLAGRLNYQTPKTCKNIVCSKKAIACPKYTRAINIADKDSCCPFYICEGKENTYGLTR